MKLWRVLVATAAVVFRRRAKPVAAQGSPGGGAPGDDAPPPGGTGGSADRVSAAVSGDGAVGGDGRIVPAGSPDPRAEMWVVICLVIASMFAAGFVVGYAMFSPLALPNEYLGATIGLCFVFIGIALTIVAKRLVVTEELEEDYPTEHPEKQSEIAQIIKESGSRFTRKKLLLGAAGLTGGTLGLAAIAPAISLGPLWWTHPLDLSPWRRGTRLVDESGAPMLAAYVYERTFYTAFAEGADPENIGSSIVVLRLNPSKIHLPAGRRDWTPDGIIAYSKICTHAGCAVALYRKPTFGEIEPQPALVCPCHYSTFDPFTGGQVLFGPAGRPLPQLPLYIDSAGYLRSAGNFSGRVGPGWWDVREPAVYGKY
jgi:ubiquinol-cytochrome c reductase iron-sulfur subunit